MRTLISFILILIALLSLGVICARQIGPLGRYPIDFGNRRAPPETAQLTLMLPAALGDFRRQQIIEPMHGVVDNAHLIARGSALYHRPGAANSIYLELKLYSTPAVADLLFDPENWPPHATNQDKYFVRGSPISYIFTEIRNTYLAYQIDYVRGSWNVSIQSSNDLTGLLTFANLYPY